MYFIFHSVGGNVVANKITREMSKVWQKDHAISFTFFLVNLQYCPTYYSTPTQEILVLAWLSIVEQKPHRIPDQVFRDSGYEYGLFNKKKTIKNKKQEL